jgi:uncharacterized protein (TIGR02594 family)
MSANTTINDMIMVEARKMLGTWEWAGEDHNPAVLALYADAGHPEIRADEVPWCAAYVGAVLARLGLPKTNSLLARSYEKWGEEVKGGIANAKQGDVVVLKRGTQEWQGHVGFFDRATAHKVYLLGGNQNNQVNVSAHHRDSVVAVRRMPAPKQPMTTAKKAAIGGGGAVLTTGIGTGAFVGVGQLDGNAQLLLIGGVIVIAFGCLILFRKAVGKMLFGG